MNSFDIDLDYIYSQANDKYNKQIKELVNKYRDGRNIISMDKKNILLVDEGLNTGLTMMACIKSAINQGAKSVSVAVPVLPLAIVADIESIADDLYCVEAPAHFVSIDFYYKNLDEVDFETIMKIINNK